jgi:Arc/MetJ-type ribon-helix-helix transcriptional regulator
MSSVDDFEKRIKELRDEIEKELSKVMEELKNESKNISTKLDELKSKEDRAAYEELKKLLYDARNNLSDLKLELRKLEHKFRSQLHDLRMDIERSGLSHNDKIKLDDMVNGLNDLLRDMSESIRDSLEDLGDLVGELRARLREAIRSMYRKGHGIISVGIKSLPDIGKIIDDAMEIARRGLEEATTVISSVRIPESDAKIIDELVDAGLFKSRNEALAFFMHKGIESSKEWLSKVNERITRIKELQDEIRKELDELFKR